MKFRGTNVFVEDEDGKKNNPLEELCVCGHTKGEHHPHPTFSLNKGADLYCPEEIEPLDDDFEDEYSPDIE